MAAKKTRYGWLTIPNLLSVIRIVLVPFFAYYFIKGNTVLAVSLLVLGGLSDCFDGLIARKFNQITEIGKILDPLADKITQGTVALCLAIKYPEICPFLILFLIKEIGMLCCGVFLILSRKKKPGASKWFGKVSTVLFYVSCGAIFFMEMIKVSVATFDRVSNILLCITTVMMVYSAVRYFKIYLGILRNNSSEDNIDIKEELKQKVTTD